MTTQIVTPAFNLRKELAHLKKTFDPYYEYSDDFTVWKKHSEIEKQILVLTKQIKVLEMSEGWH